MRLRAAQIRLMGAATLVLLLSGFYRLPNHPGTSNIPQPSKERKPAPDFALQESSGKTISLKDYKGKVILLNFWATWCHGCKQEIPWYMEFAAKYAKAGLIVIGASMDDDGWKSVKPFIEEKKLNYTIVVGNENLANKYGLDSMPLSVLIDRSGRIADSHSGVVDKDSWEREIQKLLEEI